MTTQDLTAFFADNQEVVREIVDRFSDYGPRQSIDDAKLRLWLNNFNKQHWSLALKLAGTIDYYSTDRINQLTKKLYAIINQQTNSEGISENSALYVPLGTIAESGGDIIRRFRNINRLHNRTKQFIEARDLPCEVFKLEKPILFFLDDFIGSGKQIRDYWDVTLSQLVPEYYPLYVGVIAAFTEGIQHIERNTPLKVLTVNTLTSRNQLLKSANTSLTNSEKSAIKRYCEQAGNKPLGFGNLALLVSFTYSTPNNAPSVLRGSKKQKPWYGLLPQWEDL